MSGTTRAVVLIEPAWLMGMGASCSRRRLEKPPDGLRVFDWVLRFLAAITLSASQLQISAVVRSAQRDWLDVIDMEFLLNMGSAVSTPATLRSHQQSNISLGVFPCGALASSGRCSSPSPD